MRNPCLAFIFLALLLVSAVHATETRRWTVDTTEELLKGRGEGVAVTVGGRLRPVEGWTAGPSFAEPVVMAGTRAPDGSLIVGTGHPARLYRVRKAKAELLTEVPAEQITALLATPDQGVLVATVAPGVLYRWKDDTLNEVGRLGEGGIWDLAMFNGGVVAAGGPPASLYRLGSRGLQRWVELPDIHARCLEPRGDQLLVGTSGKGLILGVDGLGRVGVLADSPFTEISDLAVGGDSVWAAALVGEPEVRKVKKKNGENGQEKEAVVTVVGELKLPKVNGSTATSEVMRLTPEGGLLSVHRFTNQVATAIAWDGGGLLVGTGFEGEVWRFVADGGARLATVDAVQVVAVVDGGAALLTQGPGGVLVRDAERKSSARFRSQARQFERPVRFGSFRVDPPSAGVRIRFRSGVSAKPDDTWLPWTDWLPAADGGVVPLPAGSSLQWELDLLGDGGAADEVDRVEIAVMEVNLPPRVKSFTVEEPGVVYLAAPPPSGPVVDAAHPDVNGIFTVIDEKTPPKKASAKGKKFYREGFRTVSWEVADPNGDPLRFLLEIEDREGFRLQVRQRLTGTQVGVDTSALPDGTYRFVLEATDAPGNPIGALETTSTRRWFTVDNTAPEIDLERQGDRWSVVVRDALSPIVRAEWSRDGERWEALAPADGILDGVSERFGFPAAAGRHLVVVRVVDRQHNRATAGAVEE